MGNEKKKFLNLPVREVLIAMKEWFIENKLPAFVYLLIGMSIVLGIFSKSFRDHFLFDRYGKFQWVGVSAIFAGLGLYWNANLKRQEIRANIISKNELDTLTSFNKNSSELIAISKTYVQELKIYNKRYFKLKKGGYKKTDTPDIRIEKLNEIVSHLNSLYYDFEQRQSVIKLNIYIDDKNIDLEFLYKGIKELIHSIDTLRSGVASKNNIEDIDFKKASNAIDEFEMSASKYANIVLKRQIDRLS